MACTELASVKKRRRSNRPLKPLRIPSTIFNLTLVEDRGMSLNSSNRRRRFGKFVCVCGVEIVAEINAVAVGNRKSCGCLNELSHLTTHGYTGTRVHSIWKGMRKRCNDPNQAIYKYYGGRGISCSDEWADFSIFLKDMHEPPSERHTLERNDVNGNYCKNNCRWATYTEQGYNRRDNHLITWEGETKCRAEWAALTGISSDAIRHRLKRGWTVERALTEQWTCLRLAAKSKTL